MYHLTLLNYTPDILSITFTENLRSYVLYPSFSTPPLSCRKRKSLSELTIEALAEKALDPGRQPYYLKLDKCKGISGIRLGWELVKAEIPYTVYRVVLSRRYEKLILFPKRKLSSFLADMPSTLPLSSLLLPGSHDSVAFYGWPISQCQDPNSPLATQFSLGIRVLDIRLAIVNGVLISYHGIYPQKLAFLDILTTVKTFLTSADGKTETIVMSIKQEDQASVLFSQLVHEAVYHGPCGKDMWFLENRVPTLGEVRGKIVLFSRFGGNGEGWEGGLEGLGIHPSTWPDSKKDGFEWWLKGTRVKTHDWYSIGTFLSIPEKATEASQILLQPRPAPVSPVLSITYLSASSLLAFPHTVSCGFGFPSSGFGVEGVNSRVGKWILSLFSAETKVKEFKGYHSLLEPVVEPRLRGWCFMDFISHTNDVGLVGLLVECNYRGRTTKEEGWP